MDARSNSLVDTVDPQLTPRQRYLRQLAFSAFCWSGLIILEASQVYAADVPWGRVLPVMHYLAWATFNWFVMVPLTPLIYQLGERYPILGPRWSKHVVVPHALCVLRASSCKRSQEAWWGGFTRSTMSCMQRRYT
jgi:hypothetical protein